MRLRKPIYAVMIAGITVLALLGSFPHFTPPAQAAPATQFEYTLPGLDIISGTINYTIDRHGDDSATWCPVGVYVSCYHEVDHDVDFTSTFSNINIPGVAEKNDFWMFTEVYPVSSGSLTVLNIDYTDTADDGGDCLFLHTSYERVEGSGEGDFWLSIAFFTDNTYGIAVEFGPIDTENYVDYQTGHGCGDGWGDQYTYPDTFPLQFSFTGTYSRDDTVISGSTYLGGTENPFVEWNLNVAFDPMVEISIGDVTQAEGNSGTTNFIFDVTLSEPNPEEPIMVDYETADGTATAGSDYMATSGQVYFSPGQTSRTVTVTVNGDTTHEPTENFYVNLSNPVHAIITDGQGVGTITNDDLVTGTNIAISINDVTQAECNSGTTPFTFTVSLSNTSLVTTTVQYTTTNGSATAPADYIATTGTLSFSAGQTTKTITVNVVCDLLYETTETFFVDLSNPVNAILSDTRGVGNITNDDTAPSLSINNVSVTEGNAGTTTLNFAVSLSAASGVSTTVQVATGNGTAIAPADYTAIPATTLTFSPGQTSKMVTVNVVGELLYELNETVLVNLSSPGNATIADNQGVGTITNDDTAPTISINNVTLAEGNSGTKAFNFTVSLSAASGVSTSVQYATGNDSASAPGDFTAANGTLTFSSGQTSKQITVMVNGDLTHETHETFNVNLSNATNATIADNQGVGQINNDDASPTIRVNDLARTEGGIGVQTNLPFTVTLSNPSYQTITVQFTTSDGTATAADSDYTGIGLTTLSFAPGVTSRNVTVKITGDAKHEPHETLNFNLSNPTNATIADALGVGTIANDDSRPVIRVNDVIRAEGNSGTTNFPFVVTLSHPSYQTITVNFATSNGTATAGTDYTARSGSLSFAPGATSRTVTVLGNGDTTVEPNETFNFTLSTAVNATIADALGIGTLTNDDSAGFVAPLTLSAFAASLTEGESTSYTVALAAPPTELLGSDSVSVQLSFDPAYLSVTPALLSFDATNWNIPQTVTVLAVDDQHAAQQTISLPVLHTVSAGDVSLNGAPFGVTITDNDALLVPVAPELPQIEAVAPVSPDAPVQPVQIEAVPLMPAGAATGNPVMFMWRAASGASSYTLHITTESGEPVYTGTFSAAVDCAGEICQALPDVALTNGVNYLWSIQADSQPRSFAMLFSYTDTTFSPIVTP